MERAYPIIFLKPFRAHFFNSYQKFTCIRDNVFSKNSIPIRIHTAETGMQELVLCLRASFPAPPDKVRAFGVDGSAILPREPSVYIPLEACDFIYIKFCILQSSLRWICRSFVQKFAQPNHVLFCIAEKKTFLMAHAEHLAPVIYCPIITRALYAGKQKFLSHGRGCQASFHD